MPLTERLSFYAGIWLQPKQRWRGEWSPYIEIAQEVGDTDVTAAVRFGGPTLLANSVSVGDIWPYVQARRETGEGRQRLQVYPPKAFLGNAIDTQAITAIEGLTAAHGINWEYTHIASSSVDVMIGEALVDPKTIELYSRDKQDPNAEPHNLPRTRQGGFARVTSSSFIAAALRAGLKFSMAQRG